MANRQAWRNEGKAMLALAWPLVVGNLAQASINATDVVLLGRVGPRTLAAAALGSNLYIFMLVLGLGLLSASSPLIAQARGKRAHPLKDVRRTVHQTQWMAIALAVPAMALLWHTRWLLTALGQDAALAADAQLFVRARLLGLPAVFLYIAFRSFAVALERPLWPLVIGLAAVPVNALLNAGLIFGLFGLPRLGLLGAGLGSAITDYLTLAAMVVVLFQHRVFRRYRLVTGFSRPDGERLATLLGLGAPIALTLAFEVSVFNAAVILMGWLGTTPLAAHAIAIQIATITFMVPLGLSQAATVRVGLAAGRADKAGVGRAGWTALTSATLFMAVMALLMVSAPHLLIQLFLDRADPANAPVEALAAQLILIAALFQIVDGVQVVGQGMLRGLKDTTLPMLFAAVGYWPLGLGLGAWLAFSIGMGAIGIWLGLAAGLAVVAALLTWRWLRRDRLGLIPSA